MSLIFKSNGEIKKTANRANATLAELAAEAGLPLNLPCGGTGACNGCLVRLKTGRYRIAGIETSVAAGTSIEARACQTIVLSPDAEVVIPGRTLLIIGECSSTDFSAARKNLYSPAHDATGLGIACDIGTTTVAVLLTELATGEILARASAYNRQIEMADNIASRITVCADDANIKKLQALLVNKTLIPLFSKLADQAHRSISEVTQIIYSGNTVMCHLALGLSPMSIGTLPFEPLTKVYPEHAAHEMGLSCCPNARLRTVPSIAGYVGGDVVCDLYISNPNGEVELLIDIGTNGEIVLNDHGTLTATATAAGPAFEGAGLLHGCRAADGVIETIICRADDSIDVETIGGLPANGLCGSAAVDFIATALETGLINSIGRFDMDRVAAAGRLARLDCHGYNVNACIIVPATQSGLDEAVMITEFDVSQILKAKAAVYAGICTLIERSGHTLPDVQRIVLAGGFAAHLKLQNAVTIGLLPEFPLERYEVTGNGSLAGAYAALGQSSVWNELHRIAEIPDTCHLAETTEFKDRFVDALAMPNLDPDEFPQTTERLGF